MCLKKDARQSWDLTKLDCTNASGHRPKIAPLQGIDQDKYNRISDITLLDSYKETNKQPTSQETYSIMQKARP